MLAKNCKTTRIEDRVRVKKGIKLPGYEELIIEGWAR
jgi:hypothetical protein